MVHSGPSGCHICQLDERNISYYPPYTLYICVRLRACWFSTLFSKERNQFSEKLFSNWTISISKVEYELLTPDIVLVHYVGGLDEGAQRAGGLQAAGGGLRCDGPAGPGHAVQERAGQTDAGQDEEGGEKQKTKWVQKVSLHSRGQEVSHSSWRLSQANFVFLDKKPWTTRGEWKN